MNKHNPVTRQATTLRSRAERKLQRADIGIEDPAKLPPDKIRSLFHNLQVHEIELEMQNDELRRTQEALETSRDRYSELFDFAPVGYFTLNREDRILEVNLTAAQLLLTDRSMLMGRLFSGFITAESRGHYQHLRRRLLTECSSTDDDIIMQRTDGSPLPVQLSWLNTEGDEADELRIAISDISERKLLEERRNLFFSIASHELRTPVTSLTLALEMLVNSDASHFSKDQRTMLDTAWSGARRLHRLVSEILEMQRTHRGSMTYRTRIVELSPVLHEAVNQCRLLADRREVSLDLRDSPLDLWIEVDADRLIQVLFNLLTNALRYSPSGSRVVIESSQIGGTVRVSVTDQGPGIPENFREHMFEPFAQAEPSLEDDLNGQHLGLGLNIARNIMQHFGGHIGYSSKPNVATTFYFELPLHRGPT